MWGKPKKQTPAAIKKLAGRVLRVGHPLDEAKLRDAMRSAILAVDPMVPIDHPDKHNVFADRFIDAMGAAMAPLFDDLHTLAGHALADD
jgi:hypothetical protein